MTKKKLLESLDIDLFEKAKESDYKKRRADFISKYTKYVASTRAYHPGSFFSSGYWTGIEGHDEKDPIQGEAKWNELYPEGYDSWKIKQYTLNSLGEQQVIDKVNEIIAYINKSA